MLAFDNRLETGLGWRQFEMLVGKLKKLKKNFSFLSFKNASLYFIAIQTLVFLSLWSGLLLNENLFLGAKLIVNNFELWRIFSFVFMPPIIPVYGMQLGLFDFLYLFLNWFIFYYIAQYLENHLGSFIFNFLWIIYYLFILLGVFIIQLIFPQFSIIIRDQFFFNGLFFIMFLAYALLNPNYEMLLFFIIPLKVKFIAFISLGIYIFSIFLHVVNFNILYATLHIITLLNFYLFFSTEIQSFLGKSRFEKRITNTINEDASDVMIHKCIICGKNSINFPELEFRYRNSDNGLKCYCNLCRNN